MKQSEAQLILMDILGEQSVDPMIFLENLGSEKEAFFESLYECKCLEDVKNLVNDFV